jgi:hypothetical protein
MLTQYEIGQHKNRQTAVGDNKIKTAECRRIKAFSGATSALLYRCRCNMVFAWLYTCLSFVFRKMNTKTTAAI